jgi:hypothetical protein
MSVRTAVQEHHAARDERETAAGNPRRGPPLAVPDPPDGDSDGDEYHEQDAGYESLPRYPYSRTTGVAWRGALIYTVVDFRLCTSHFKRAGKL